MFYLFFAIANSTDPNAFKNFYTAHFGISPTVVSLISHRTKVSELFPYTVYRPPACSVGQYIIPAL
jgi:hypothetical protein